MNRFQNIGLLLAIILGFVPSILANGKSDFTVQNSETLFAKAKSFSSSKNTDSAQVYYEAAIGKARIERKWSVLGSIENAYGLFLSKQGHSKRALGYFAEAIEAFSKVKDQEGISLSFNYIGYTHKLKKNYAVSIGFFQHAITIAEQAQFDQGVGKAAGNLGGAFHKMGANDSAIHYFNLSLERNLKAKYDNGISHAYNNMGVIYAEDSNYEAAIEYFQKSYDLYERKENKVGMANAVNNLGVVEQSRGNYDLALEKYLAASELWNQSNDPEAMGVAYSNIAEVNALKGVDSEALRYYFKAKEVYADLNDPMGVANIHLMLGEHYLNRKIYRKAYVSLKPAIGSFSDGNLKEQLKLNQLLFQSFEGMGEYESALEALKKKEAIEYRLSLRKAKRLLAEMEAKYELNKQSEQLQAKAEELIEAKEKINYQRNLLILAVLAILFISVLFVRLHLNNKALKEAHKVLVRKTKEVIHAEDALNDQKASKGKVSGDKSKELLDRIQQFLMEEKAFLDKGFTIDQLAEKVESNRTYVSQVINTEKGMSFNHFINEYRIKEAIKLLDSEDRAMYTIESIAYSVGFSSKSSFNPAFKKYTGVTPSKYLKLEKA